MNQNFPPSFELTSKEITQHIYKLYFKSWDDWLNQRLMPPNQLTRSEHLINLLDCIADALDCGNYKFDFTRNEIVNKFLTWLYLADEEHFYGNVGIIGVPPPKHRDLEKDRIIFNEIFPEKFWKSFRNRFGYDNLFATENGAEYIWSNLQFWVYRFISMDSPHIVKYDEEDKRQEEEHINKLIDDGVLVYNKKGQLVDAASGSGNIDPYLLDTHFNSKWY